MRSRAPRLKPPAVGLVVTLVAASLVACSPSDDPTTSPTAEPTDASTSPQDAAPAPPVFTGIELPAEFRPTGPQAREFSVLPETGDSPTVVVARTAQPGEPSRLSAWTASASSATRVPLDIDLAAPPAVLKTAASEELSVIAGSTWSEGRLEPFLASSTDREVWALAELGELAPGLLVEGVAVHDSTVVLAGTPGFTSEVQAILVREGEAQLIEVSTGAEGPTTVAGVAISPTQIVVLGTLEGEDRRSRPVVWVGDAQGGGFGEAIPLSDSPDADVSGIVSTGTEWVVVGTEVDSSNDDRPVAWVSDDGKSWSLEDAQASLADGWTPWLEGVDSVVGPPAVDREGRVYMWASGSSGLWGSIFVRDVEGGWAISYDRTSRTKSWAAGPGGVLGVSPEGNITVVNEVSGWARLSFVGALGWTDGSVLAEPGGAFSIDHVEPHAEGPVLVGSRTTTIGSGADWARETSYLRVRLPGSGAAWSDPGVDLEHAVYVESDDGTQVVLGREDEQMVLKYRSAGASEWSDAEVEPLATRSLGTLEHGPAGWVAALSIEVGEGESTTSQVAVLTSTDGVSWSRVPETALGQHEGSDAYAREICWLPTGEPLVVGNIDAGAPTQRPAAWTSNGGSWSLVTPEVELGTWFNSCAATDGGVVVSSAGTPNAPLMRTQDGLSFEELRGRPWGTGAVFEVDGVAVMLGGRQDLGGMGFAVWLSLDGTSWRGHEIPTADPGWVLGRAFDLGDGRLLVSWQMLGSTQTWVMDDVRAAYERGTPAQRTR